MTATARSGKVPGPDHPITIAANPARVVVSVAGRIIADTRAALTLREAAYPPVQYIPRRDVDMSLLDRTSHATYCPFIWASCLTGSCRSPSTPPMTCSPLRQALPELLRTRVRLAIQTNWVSFAGIQTAFDKRLVPRASWSTLVPRSVPDLKREPAI